MQALGGPRKRHIVPRSVVSSQEIPSKRITQFQSNVYALVCYIRDFDAAETVPEKMSKVRDVKGVRGLVKLAKEIAVTATTGSHDNEFIGRCQIPLKVREFYFNH